MSTDNRNRVQKGVSAGGQFATEAKSEATGVALAPARQEFTDPNDLPRIPVTLIQQRINDYDEDEEVGRIEVDGRTLFAGMHRDDLEALMESGQESGDPDRFYALAVEQGITREWDGPYEFNVGEALQELNDENPLAFDTFSDARLDPNMGYRPVNGRLASSEETWDQDCETQYAKFEQMKRDTALLQLRGHLKSVYDACPEAKTLNFFSDGNLGDPVYLKTITMHDGSEVEADQVDGLNSYEFEYAPGGAIEESQSYDIDEIRRFRPEY